MWTRSTSCRRTSTRRASEMSLKVVLLDVFSMRLEGFRLIEAWEEYVEALAKQQGLMLLALQAVYMVKSFKWLVELRMQKNKGA